MPCGMLLDWELQRFSLSFPITPSAMRWIQQLEILLMDELPNNHLGCMKPCKWCDIYHIGWCRNSSINRITTTFKTMLLQGDPPKTQESGWFTWTFTRLYPCKLQSLVLQIYTKPKRFLNHYLNAMEYLPTWQNHVVHKSIFSRKAKYNNNPFRNIRGWDGSLESADGKSLLLGTMLPLRPDFPFWALPPRNWIGLERWINMDGGPKRKSVQPSRCLPFVSGTLNNG